MSLFHTHTWVTLGRDYVPPSERTVTMSGPGAVELVEALVYGFTTISQRCSVCGREDTYQVRGHFVEGTTEGGDR